MDCKEIAEELTAIHAALVEKIGVQPFVAPSLTVSQTSKARITIYRDFNAGNYELATARGDTIAECLAVARRIISKLPDPDAAAKQTWHKKLGKVIDEGHALALPDEVMQPLRAGSQAMSENLLSGPDQ